MTRDLKGVVHEIIDEAIHAENFSVIDTLCHRDFRGHTFLGEMDRTTFREFVAAWKGGFPDLSCTVEHLVQEGDEVAWKVRAVGTHRDTFFGAEATGRPLDMTSWHYCRARDGKPLEYWFHFDRLELAQQLGIAPGSIPGT